MDYAFSIMLRSQKMGWLLYSLELETMTNGLLNGDIPILKTLKTSTGKSVERND
jgi:hypothetical protein